METKIQNTGFLRQAAVAAVGFGIGGLLWGLEAYRGTVGAGESFTNPFSYILGAVALAVFGGLALAYATHLNGSVSLSRFLLSKHTLKIVGIGLVGWLVAFLLPAVWVEQLSIGSVLLLSIVLSPLNETGAFVDTIINYIGLDPALHMGGLFLEFLASGAIVGLVYSLILKTKILKTVLWSAGGFALASLIGPILGNLIGNLFGLLLVSYLVTFLIIGIIFAASLTYGLRRSL